MELIQDKSAANDEVFAELLAQKKTLKVAIAELAHKLNQLQDSSTVLQDRLQAHHGEKPSSPGDQLNDLMIEKQNLEMYCEEIEEALVRIEDALSELTRQKMRHEDEDQEHPLSEYLNGY